MSKDSNFTLDGKSYSRDELNLELIGAYSRSKRGDKQEFGDEFGKLYAKYEANVNELESKYKSDLSKVKRNSNAYKGLGTLYRQALDLNRKNVIDGLSDIAGGGPLEQSLSISDTLAQAEEERQQDLLEEEEKTPEEELPAGEDPVSDGPIEPSKSNKGFTTTITKGGSDLISDGSGNINTPKDSDNIGTQTPGDNIDVPTEEDTNNSQAVRNVLRKRRGRASTIGLGRRSSNTNLSSQVVNLLGA